MSNHLSSLKNIFKNSNSMSHRVMSPSFSIEKYTYISMIHYMIFILILLTCKYVTSIIFKVIKYATFIIFKAIKRCMVFYPFQPFRRLNREARRHLTNLVIYNINITTYHMGLKNIYHMGVF
jgi:hypothetical protein